MSGRDAGAPVDVSVVTVSYRCCDELLGLLASLEAHPCGCVVEVLVADNASGDDTERVVRERYPEVGLTQMGYNAGFARGNDAAIARSRGRYLFLLNPDARVTEGCIDALVTFMDDHPDVAAAGPKLLNRDLTLQYSIRNLPTVRGSLLEAAFLHHAFPRLLARYGEMVLDETAYRSSHPVGWVSGAAMFVRRAALDRVGLLDGSFFLFSEEIDWFKRMHDRGLPVWFVPDAVVIHRDDKRVLAPGLAAIDVDSRRRYWRKHASRTRAFAAMAVLGLNMAVRYVLWSLVAIRSEQDARPRRAALRAGLRALTPGGRPSRPEPPPSAGARDRACVSRPDDSGEEAAR